MMRVPSKIDTRQRSLAALPSYESKRTMEVGADRGSSSPHGMRGVLLGSGTDELRDVGGLEGCILVGFGGQGTKGSGHDLGGFHETILC